VLPERRLCWLFNQLLAVIAGQEMAQVLTYVLFLQARRLVPVFFAGIL
jgi:hypothetical protein